MTLAITGATGFVGQALLDRALAEGQELRALTRRDQPPRAGVTWVQGDLDDTAALDRLVQGAEAVIHVAGVVNTPDPAELERGNVAGTLNLVEAALAAGVPRFVCVSSLSARERQIMRMVVAGMSSAAIGQELHLSPKTVDTYRSRIMAKLNVSGVTALVRLAVREGLVEK